jgi:hypothetical protein
MASSPHRAVTHDGDIVKIDGKPLRMEYIVRDAFWADGKAIVLLDPDAFLDSPGGGRKAPRDPVKNLRAYSPSGELRWEADLPEQEDHYYLVESRDPLVALSLSAYRCDIDLASGRVLAKKKLK